MALEAVEARRPKNDKLTPRVVFFGKGALGTLGQDIAPKIEIFEDLLDATVVGVARSDHPDLGSITFIAVPRTRAKPLDSAFFYAGGAYTAIRQARVHNASAVVCQSPYEGAAALVWKRLLREPVSLVIELHGDWRTAGRLYGSRTRKVLAPLADRVAVWALRRADRIRVVANQLEELAREYGYCGEIDNFVTYSNFRMFLEDLPLPLPDSPQLLFVGSLEPYKGIDVLLAAWKIALQELPSATLRIVGDGPLMGWARERAAQDGTSSSIQFAGALATSAVKAELDRACALVLASRSEGLPRVILEAFARGRPVVSTNVGGISELVVPGVTGALVEPDNPEALAHAITALLQDKACAEDLGRRGREVATERDPLIEYRRGIERLAAWARERR